MPGLTGTEVCGSAYLGDIEEQRQPVAWPPQRLLPVCQSDAPIGHTRTGTCLCHRAQCVPVFLLGFGCDPGAGGVLAVIFMGRLGRIMRIAQI